MRTVVIFFFLCLFVLPVNSYAENNADAPLTLLNPPQQQSPKTQQPTITNIEEELHDIHGPVPLDEQPPYLLIFAALGLLLLIAAVLIWLRKKKGGAQIPVVPPWERALRDLAEAKKLLHPDKGLLYMDRVSQILRSYIESRFSIRSTRQTTREFLQGLTATGNGSPLHTYKVELQGCLELADMAKFAHHLPELDNLQQMEYAVTSFIKRTEPEEPKPALQPKNAGFKGRSTTLFRRGRS